MFFVGYLGLYSRADGQLACIKLYTGNAGARSYCCMTSLQRCCIDSSENPYSNGAGSFWGNRKATFKYLMERPWLDPEDVDLRLSRVQQCNTAGMFLACLTFPAVRSAGPRDIECGIRLLCELWDRSVGLHQHGYHSGDGISYRIIRGQFNLEAIVDEVDLPDFGF